MLDDAGINYTVINAIQNKKLAIQYGILQAPTLLVFHNGQQNMYCGLEKIIKYIHEQ